MLTRRQRKIIPPRTAVRSKPSTEAQVSLRDLDDIMQEYDFVDVLSDSSAIVVSEKSADKQFTASKVNISNLGSASPSPFTAWLRREYNPALRDLQGLRKYDEMKRSDSTVRGALRAIKTPILGARWFVKPATDGIRDKNIADFVTWNLTEGMSISFGQVIQEALLMLDYGYYMFEKVFTDSDYRQPGKVCWQKFAPRHPMDVVSWDWDANGAPVAVEIYNPTIITGGLISSQTTTIDIDKLVVFTFDKEAGDLTGVPLLRSAYKPWYYKSQLEKIDAIQKERHGIGVPIIILPVGFSNDDKLIAEQIGRNLRTNERAHVVLPPGWSIEFAKLQGQLTDALKSVEYHNTEILKNILATFIENRSGSPEANQDLFLKSCRYVAEQIESVINLYCIPQLVNYNWSKVKRYPQLKVRRIGEVTDWRTLSFALRNVIGAGIIRPDDPLEELVREEMDLGPVDLSTARIVTTQYNQNDLPEQPSEDPSAGLPTPSLPRQTNLPSNGLDSKNIGIDRSGGK